VVLVVALLDAPDVLVALGGRGLELLVASVQGLPEGDVVLDVDGGAVLPHGLGVEPDLHDRGVVLDGLDRLGVVRVDLPAAVLRDPDGSAELGGVEVAVVHQGAVQVGGVEVGGDVRDGEGEVAAVPELCGVDLLVVRVGQRLLRGGAPRAGGAALLLAGRCRQCGRHDQRQCRTRLASVLASECQGILLGRVLR
jgi:hypothetical protein